MEATPFLIFREGKSTIMIDRLRFLYIITGTLLFGCVLQLQAQDEAPFPQVNIISPTASAIAKYVDFPVNYHTGVPETSIPIYTVQEGPLQLPITLSYHASGLPVLEPAGWVGAGWSLNAGGVISRSVKGIADEQVVNNNYSYFGYKGFSNYFLDSEGLIDLDYFIRGLKDGEPDLFTYSFGSYSGKFYFREDLTPVLIPEADVKIEVITKSGPPTYSQEDFIEGFKATAPDGTKYYFGITTDSGDVDPVEKSRAASATSWPSYPRVISSWYLYKIESADGYFSINISYRKEEYGYFTVSTKPCLPNCDFSVIPAKILMHGVAVDKIHFSNGQVEFLGVTLREDVSRNSGVLQDDANIEAKALDKIIISSNQSEFCKSFIFSYDYFYDNSTTPLPSVLNGNFTSDRKRLKLISLTESSCDNTESLPSYEFKYYDEEAVPRRLSLAQDHWGFFNGVTTNNSLIPPISVNAGNSYSAGDDRDSRWPEMRAGALRLIQYPTGGVVEYIYEPNSAPTTNGCIFSQTSTSIATLSAGMGTAESEYGTSYNLVITSPTAYFYRLTSMNFGSGSLYISGNKVASITSNSSEKEDYILLSPGTYEVTPFAEADNGSGVGVLVNLYLATVSCPEPEMKVVGGLRIKQINKSAGSTSPKLSIKYEYQQPNLYSIPVYAFKLKNEIFKLGWRVVNHGTEAGCIAFTENGQTYRTFYSPSSLQPLQNIQGSHIGYQKVKEIHPDGGYTLFEFNGSQHLPSGWYTLEDVCVRKIDAGVCDSNDPVYPAAPLQFDFQRGRLKISQVFDSNNILLKEDVYTYEFLENSVGGFGIATASFPDSDGSPQLLTNYQLRSAKQLWTKHNERTFDSNGTISEREIVTWFDSPFHRMPTKRSESSLSHSTRSEYRYVPDLTHCNYQCASCNDAFISATAALLTDYFSKDSDCRNSVCLNTNFLGWRDSEIDRPCYVLQGELVNCRKAAWVDYQFRLNQARIAYTNCINNCKENNNCIASGISGSADSAIKALYLLEQQNQLKLIESINWRNNIFQSARYFEFEPLAEDATKVYLKQGFETEVSNPSSTFATANILSGNIHKDDRYGNYPVATFKFSGGQLVEISDRGGVPTSFIWGFDNTVPIVKAIGINYPALLSAYTVSSSDLQSDPTLAGAQVFSYTYDPLIGITSITDANGQKTTYVYDKLGRLIRIKDHEGNVIQETTYKLRHE